MKRKNRRTARRYLALLLAMLMTSLPVTYTASAETQGTLPPDVQANVPIEPIKPFKVFDYFVTGESDALLESNTTYAIDDAPSVKAMATEMNSSKYLSYSLVLLPSVSSVPINGVCYATDDGTYFKLASRAKNAPANAKRLSGNTDCQRALAASRGIRLRNALIKNKVNPRRIVPLDFPALTMKPGGRFPNQAVTVWLLSKQQLANENIPMILAAPGPEGKPLMTYLAVDLTMCPTCVVSTETRMDGETYVVYVKVINSQGLGVGPVEAGAAPSSTEEKQIEATTPPPPPPPKPHKEGDGCWMYALGGGALGGGAGWGISQFKVDGGQGANGAGDGGDVTVCGDNPAACIGGGILLGAGTTYLACKLLKHK